MEKKLGKATNLRMAMLKNQVTQLLWYGKIETTVDRAKEVSRIAEKLLTLAITTYKDSVECVKKVKNDKGEVVEKAFRNDGVRKLAARRQLMRSVYDMQEDKKDGENRTEYKNRTGAIKHPLIEKMFNIYAPRYDKMNEDKKVSGGGYTRIIRLGKRIGDNAEKAIIELIAE